MFECVQAFSTAYKCFPSVFDCVRMCLVSTSVFEGVKVGLSAYECFERLQVGLSAYKWVRVRPSGFRVCSSVYE